jgi:hypothetical protein
MKDPAFLFYSKDFYEGTRMMLPEERACYIDLLIYQHQNGYIPDEPKRLIMYCSGVSEATLQATLQAKFKLCPKGWYNEKLILTIEQRENYKTTQSDNGKFGQIVKKIKAILGEKDTKALLFTFSSKAETIDFFSSLEISKHTLKDTLKQRLNNKAIANAIVNENKDVDLIKKEKEQKIENFDEIPTLDEFINFANEKLYQIGKRNVEDFRTEIILKYEAWKENGWKTGGEKSRKIKNWKSTLNNTIGYFKGQKSENKSISPIEANLELYQKMQQNKL